MHIVVGIIYILAGLIPLTYVVKNTDKMEPSVFGLSVEDYKIINKRKFNNLMVLQSVLISAFFLIMAIVVITYDKPVLIVCIPGMVLINMIVSIFSKKYIEKFKKC